MCFVKTQNNLNYSKKVIISFPHLYCSEQFRPFVTNKIKVIILVAFINPITMCI